MRVPKQVDVVNGDNPRLSTDVKLNAVYSDGVFLLGDKDVLQLSRELAYGTHRRHDIAGACATLNRIYIGDAAVRTTVEDVNRWPVLGPTPPEVSASAQVVVIRAVSARSVVPGPVNLLGIQEGLVGELLPIANDLLNVGRTSLETVNRLHTERISVIALYTRMRVVSKQLF